MQKEDIRIRRVIIHILDSTVGLPVLSDREITFGSDFADFLRDHIFRVLDGDDSNGQGEADPCRTCPGP